MSFLSNIYSKSIQENERQMHIWQNHLHELKSLDFNVFADKLKVPALIPIGSRIFFRGNLIHTNEIIAALGADYFAKCSLKQAEVLKQHRISVAESNLNTLQKENEYLKGQLQFKSHHEEGPEIIEPYNEDDDKAWRDKHRENVRKYKQSNESKEVSENTTEEELWNRLEELELQEELDNEYIKVDENPNKNDNIDFVERTEAKVEIDNNSIETETSYVNEILSKAIKKQNELESKLLELTNRERGSSKTETDLISRLDELETLDELQDEMDRLDDMLYEEKESPKGSNKIPKAKIYFQEDKDASETVEITFSHSDVLPETKPYDPERGIQKPSDIYEAFSISDKPKKYESILSKESKYPITETVSPETTSAVPVRTEHKEIVLKDVTESKSIKVEQSERPMSLFKKKRMQKK